MASNQSTMVKDAYSNGRGFAQAGNWCVDMYDREPYGDDRNQRCLGIFHYGVELARIFVCPTTWGNTEIIGGYWVDGRPLGDVSMSDKLGVTRIFAGAGAKIGYKDLVSVTPHWLNV